MKPVAHKKPSIPVHPLVQGLGWFSLALGLAELLAPREVSRGAGIRRQDSLLRSYGLREIGTGLGILLSRNPRPWLWGRVAGDALDFATVAATADTRKPARLSASSLALLGVGLLDIYFALNATPKNLRSQARVRTHDYRNRSGFPRSASEMHGAVRSRAAQKASSPNIRTAAE
jgi:hypothetical protein